MPASIRRARRTTDYWPGFVDALSTLLIIVLFLLMVFTLAQYFLTETLSGRDEALDRLNRQVAELADMLALERAANAELRQSINEVSSQLQTSIAERDKLSAQLAALLPERDSLRAGLADVTAERDKLASELDAMRAGAREASDEASKLSAELEDAFKIIQADRDKIELRLREIESLRRDIVALKEVRDALESRVSEMAASLKTAEDRATKVASDLAAEKKTAGSLRDRTKSLEAELADERERTALAQKTIEERDVRLKQLLGQAGQTEAALDEQKKLSAEAQARVDLLNRQIAALRQQLARIANALEASEAKNAAQKVQIVDLGKRLNAALATKVAELARYRSEFFGRLREALGDRKDIRIVGDRFVFQSEVLFPSGSAELAEDGQRQLAHLAGTLKEVAARIPKDLDWVLRVDGHTDRVPIATSTFPSNWELSTARAISVVKQLIALGIPPQRLAATGFGEYQPLDPADTPEAYRRNRRIEIKLTNR